MKRVLSLLLVLFLATNCFAGNILSSGGGALPTQYGTGEDGNITVTAGTVKIEDIYEDDSVSGVTTHRGAGKGLNKGAGTYDPESGTYIKASNFTIDSGATLTHGTAWGAGGSNKNGIIWISCIATFTNNGAISLNAKGASATKGEGGGTTATNVTGATGGDGYGNSDIGYSTWGFLYGSGGGTGADGYHTGVGSPYNVYGGGGGGGAGHITSGANGVNGASDSGASSGGDAGGGTGAYGGGAIRIYAPVFTNSGIIVCNGANGVNGSSGTGDWGGAGGGGGGGSGGTIYIETFNGTLGTNKMTCSAGSGGSGGTGFSNGGAGGAGKQGRIHIEGSYTGSTNDPAIL